METATIETTVKATGGATGNGFKPGECGLHRRSKRYQQIRDQISAELGGKIDSAIDRLQLDQIADLMDRSQRPGISPTDKVRLMNLSTRLLRGLRAKYSKPKPAPLLSSWRDREAT